MIVLYTLFAVVVVAAITYYTYHFTINLLTEKETRILSDSLGYLEKDISVRFDAINEDFINIFSDSKFIDLYMQNATDEKEAARKVALSSEFKNYFLDLKMRNGDLMEAILLSSGEDVYSSEFSTKYDLEGFKRSSYYTASMENKNRILYKNSQNGDSDDYFGSEYFGIVRSFYYMKDDNSVSPGVGYISDKDQDYSVLLFLLKKEWLQNMIREEAVKRQTSVFIYDAEGNVVVQEGSIDWLSQEDADTLDGEIKAHLSENYDGGVINAAAGVNIRQIDLLNWSIVYVYDMNILYRQAGYIRKVAVAVFAVSVIAVFLIASVISRTVVRPIKDLARSMDNVVDNNMKSSFVPKYNDEIAYLGRKFAAMIQKITDLMEEVKHVEKQKHVEELKALQAQINPHFLYNTLDTVYWMNKMDGNDNAANMVADLADFFRLSLNKGEDITSVEREVEHVKKYLKIQQIRMEEKFEYEVVVEKDLEDYKVPKLILQPLVENTLLHGFEKLDRKGMIEIEVTREQEQLVFYITDNGCGMSVEKREQINQSRLEGEGNHGYAIENVKARIKLYAGDAYGVWYDTNLTEGTRVRVSFPVEFHPDL